jgi:hypothetical protein
MVNLNFPTFIERVRLEVPHDYMLVHPRLCETNGEALMEDLLKKEDVVYITAACKIEKQAKLLRDGFQRAGAPMNEKTWKPVSIQFKTTEEAFEAVRQAVEEAGV